jgi:nucleoside-diphosphate-sugar epimerase
VTTLVTGATGLVGGHLVEALAAGGGPVRALVRPGSDARAVERLQTCGAEVIRGDVTDGDAVAAAVRGSQVVHHLAAPRGRDKRSAREHQAVNVTGTANVLRAALEAGAHVVFGSTGGVSGRFCGTPLIEGPPSSEGNPYHETKARAERLVADAARRHGLSAVVARLSAVYGPRDLRWLRLCRDVLHGRPLLPGGGRAPYHLTHVRDVVRGLLLCGAVRGTAAPCWHLAADPVPTLREVVEAIAAAAGTEARVRSIPAAPIRAALSAARLLRPLGVHPSFLHKAETFAAGRAYDVSRARRDLGFRSEVGLRTGVRELVSWYVEHGYLTPLARGGEALPARADAR